MRALAGLLGLVLLCGVLDAAVALKLDLDSLTDNAVLVVRGKLDSKDARWDADRTGIWTHHSVTVTETLKGEHGASREFVTRGGVVGDVGQHVAGSGTFTVGSEYVFFLWKDDSDRYQLVGMVQGAFAITEENGETRVSNSFSGLTLVKDAQLAPEQDRTPLRYTLADLKAKVAARAEAGK